MKTIAVALLLAAPAAAFAQAAAEPTPHRLVQERYCEKLREGALPFVHFVRRMAPIYQYTYFDFAPEYPGAPVKADCRVSPERAAAVAMLLAGDVTAQAKAQR